MAAKDKQDPRSLSHPSSNAGEDDSGKIRALADLQGKAERGNDPQERPESPAGPQTAKQGAGRHPIGVLELQKELRIVILWLFFTLTLCAGGACFIYSRDWHFAVKIGAALVLITLSPLACVLLMETVFAMFRRDPGFTFLGLCLAGILLIWTVLFSESSSLTKILLSVTACFMALKATDFMTAQTETKPGPPRGNPPERKNTTCKCRSGCRNGHCPCVRNNKRCDSDCGCRDCWNCGTEDGG